MISFRMCSSLVFCVLFSPLAALGSSCDHLLDHGITNITRHLSSAHAVAYKWHRNCGIDYNQASDSRVKRASVEVFGYGAGGSSSNVSEHRTKLVSWCDTNRAFAQASSHLFEESKLVSVPALSTFERCVEMARKDIKINVSPMGAHSQFVHIEIDSTHDGDLRYLGLEQKNFTCTERMVRDGDEVSVQDQPRIRNSNIQIDCERAAPSVAEEVGVGKISFAPAYISVNTSGPALPIAFPEVVQDYFVTPPTSILAFNSDRCPAGWRPFVPGQGRFIVGTGNAGGQNKDMHSQALTARKLGSVGGAETHRLTQGEMPSHSHTHNRAKRVMRKNGSHGSAEFAPGGTDTTSAVGGNAPHNNMPPYVSLLYCEKLGAEQALSDQSTK